MNFYDFYEMNQESYGHAFIVITGIAPASEDRYESVFYAICDENGIPLTEGKSNISIGEDFMGYLASSIQNRDLQTLVSKRFEIDYNFYEAEGEDPDAFFDVNDDGNIGVVIEMVREVMT